MISKEVTSYNKDGIKFSMASLWGSDGQSIYMDARSEGGTTAVKKACCYAIKELIFDLYIDGVKVDEEMLLELTYAPDLREDSVIRLFKNIYSHYTKVYYSTEEEKKSSS